MTTPKEFDVFLSYNSKDRAAAKKLAERLRDSDVRVWADFWEIPPGSRWLKVLQEAITRVKSAAVLIGSSGIGPWQDVEMDTAIRLFVSRDAPIIPVILPGVGERPSLPPMLSGYSWVDLRPRFTRPAIDRLIWGIMQTMQNGDGLSNKSPEELDAGPEQGTIENLIQLLDNYMTSRDYPHCDEILARLDASGEDVATVTWLRHIVDFERACREIGSNRVTYEKRAMENYNRAIDLCPSLRLLPSEYQILKPIGCGGLSHVYFATRGAEKLAVKSIRSKLIDNDAMKQQHSQILPRICEMTEAAQEAEGVGIAQIIETCVSEKKMVVVYEYVHGESLDWHLKQMDPVARTQPAYYVRCLNVLERVCRSLEFAHRRGIFHLDVSPSNILIVGDCDDWNNSSTIKIVDFDTARMATGAWGASYTNVLTAGTARYMDPTFLENPIAQRASNYSCDLYSVAMVAKAMFCGRPETVENPSDVCPAIPPVLDEIISVSTSHERHDRLRNAEEMRKCFCFLREMAVGNVWRKLHWTILLSFSAIILCCAIWAAIKLCHAESLDERLQVLAPLVGIICASWAYGLIIKGYLITDQVLQSRYQRLCTLGTLLIWVACIAGAFWDPKLYFLFFAAVQFSAALRALLYYGVKIDLGANRSWRLDRFGAFAAAGAGVACIAAYIITLVAGEWAAKLAMSFNIFVLLFGIGAAISTAHDARTHFAELSRYTRWRYMIEYSS